MLPALDRALHQSGPLQNLHVLGDPVERNGEPFRQPPDVDLSLRQDTQDRATGRICNSAIDLVQHRLHWSAGGFRSTIWLNIVSQPNGGILGSGRGCATPNNHQVVSRNERGGDRFLGLKPASYVTVAQYTMGGRPNVGRTGTNDEGYPKEGEKSDDEAHNRDT